MRGTRAYRALLWLYPPSFRREHGAQMVQLAQDARRSRCRSRAGLVVDVVRSLPVQHKEAFRAMTTQGKLVTAAIVIAAAAAVFLVIGGAMFALLLLLVLAWVLALLLRERNVQPSNGFWWKLTLTGAGVFALAFACFAGPWPQEWRDEVPGELAWWSGAFVFSAALVMIVAGMLTGFVQLTSRRRLTR